MMLTICIENNRVDLLPDVKRVWEDFERTVVNNPFLYDEKEFTSITECGNSPAMAKAYINEKFPTSEFGQIRISEKLLSLNPQKQHLTLLHECIHLKLLFSVLKRWDIDTKEACKQLRVAGTLFVKQRNWIASQILRLPDEILAEQCLKRDYPQLFQSRSEYYLSMRKVSFESKRYRRTDSGLLPYNIFFDIMRAEFFANLADDAKIREQLRSIVDSLYTELRTVCDEEILRFFDSIKSNLLNVVLDPLYIDCKAYQKIFLRVAYAQPSEASTLCHEAGHAVICITRGMPLEKIVLTENEKYLAHCVFGDYNDAMDSIATLIEKSKNVILRAFAGTEAAKLYGSEWGLGSDGDIETAERSMDFIELAMSLSPKQRAEMWQELWREAHKLVEENRDVIQALAIELIKWKKMKREEMSRAEVLEFVESRIRDRTE